TFDGAQAIDWTGESGWGGVDMSIYNWFRLARTPETTAARYVFIEFDMLYRVPMVEFYRGVWDEDLAGAQLNFCGPRPHWNWFRAAGPWLPPELRPFAAGVSPLAGVMLAHRTLEAICASPIPRRIFCECRLATLVNAHGFDMVEFPYPKKRNITWREDF